MNFEFEGTNGVRNFFNRIALTMGKVVHGINTPLVSGTVMLGVQDSIENRIAHEHIRRGHVYFGTEYPGPIGKLTFSHPFE